MKFKSRCREYHVLMSFEMKFIRSEQKMEECPGSTKDPQYEPSRGKTNNVVSDLRSDINRPIQSQKRARSLKFRI